MPVIFNASLYNAVFRASSSILKTRPEIWKSLVTDFPKDTPVFRYVNYRNDLPQIETAGKTIWTKLQNDTQNRWTGLDSDGSGYQGLYLSLEEPGSQDTNFPELEHYQDPTVPPNTTINYLDYASGSNPKWQSAKVSELRSLFLFSTNRTISTLNLTDPATNPLLKEIFKQSQQLAPAIFSGVTLEDLYYAPKDASFNRAIGNALFKENDIEMFSVTSVRDKKSTNLILKGLQGTPLDVLKPLGRGTFCIDAVTKKSRGVVTIDDMIYNQIFEAKPDPLLPDLVKQLETIKPFEKTMGDLGTAIRWDYFGQETDGAIRTYVLEQLSKKPGISNQSTAEIQKTLRTPELEKIVWSKMSDLALSSISSNSKFKDVYSILGLSATRSLSDFVHVEPKYNAMVKDANTFKDYITRQITDTVLLVQKNHLEENRTQLIKEISEKNQENEQIQSEINRIKESLKTITEQLKEDPTNTELQKWKKSVQDQIKERMEEKEEIDKEAKEKQREKDAADEKKEEIDKEAKENSKKLKESREHIFEK